jgi:hypothetical protein
VDDTFSIGGSAVAGPVPIGPKKSDIVPLSLCGDPTDGTDCSVGHCFGYSVGAKKEYWMKGGSGERGNEYGEIGPGNFQLLDFGQDCGHGADCIREELSGEYSESIEGNSTYIFTDTAPGNKAGPVAQGLNTRLGIYHGGMSSSEAPPDAVTYTDYDTSGNYFWYDDYLARLQSGTDLVEGGVPGRRILAVPIIKCPAVGSGKTQVEVLGYGCFFMTRPVDHTGKQIVYGQLIERCEADGSVAQSPPAMGSSFNLYKIVLYK